MSLDVTIVTRDFLCSACARRKLVRSGLFAVQRVISSFFPIFDHGVKVLLGGQDSCAAKGNFSRKWVGYRQQKKDLVDRLKAADIASQATTNMAEPAINVEEALATGASSSSIDIRGSGPTPTNPFLPH